MTTKINFTKLISNRFGVTDTGEIIRSSTIANLVMLLHLFPSGMICLSADYRCQLQTLKSREGSSTTAEYHYKVYDVYDKVFFNCSTLTIYILLFVQLTQTKTQDSLLTSSKDIINNIISIELILLPIPCYHYSNFHARWTY